MAQKQSFIRVPGATYALSNTGPLISAFQSQSFTLLTRIFQGIHISDVCRQELVKHGWEQEMETAVPQLEIIKLTTTEEMVAVGIAEQIARHPSTNDPIVENHLGEAQVITAALRSEYQDDLLLLDEQAARAIAKQYGIRISGFPGVLLLAVQSDLISTEDLKLRLEKCRVQGTHYGVAFIEQVYKMAQQSWRYK